MTQKAVPEASRQVVRCTASESRNYWRFLTRVSTHRHGQRHELQQRSAHGEGQDVRELSKRHPY